MTSNQRTIHFPVENVRNVLDEYDAGTDYEMFYEDDLGKLVCVTGSGQIFMETNVTDCPDERSLAIAVETDPEQIPEDFAAENKEAIWGGDDGSTALTLEQVELIREEIDANPELSFVTVTVFGDSCYDDDARLEIGFSNENRWMLLLNIPGIDKGELLAEWLISLSSGAFLDKDDDVYDPDERRYIGPYLKALFSHTALDEEERTSLNTCLDIITKLRHIRRLKAEFNHRCVAETAHEPRPVRRPKERPVSDLPYAKEIDEVQLLLEDVIFKEIHTEISKELRRLSVKSADDRRKLLYVTVDTVVGNEASDNSGGGLRSVRDVVGRVGNHLQANRLYFGI